MINNAALSSTRQISRHILLLDEFVISFDSIKIFSSLFSLSSAFSRNMKPNCFRRINKMKFLVHSGGVRSLVEIAAANNDSSSNRHVITREFLKKTTEKIEFYKVWLIKCPSDILRVLGWVSPECGIIQLNWWIVWKCKTILTAINAILSFNLHSTKTARMLMHIISRQEAKKVASMKLSHS